LVNLFEKQYEVIASKGKQTEMPLMVNLLSRLTKLIIYDFSQRWFKLNHAQT